LKSGNSNIDFKKLNSTTYKKLDEKQKAFIDDLVLVVVKGLLCLNIIENILVKQFDLRTDPQLVFPSCKIIIEEVLPHMMKDTLENFLLPYFNILIFIITTFPLWMKKGALDTFVLVIIF
jgi:hypothetical protein